MIKYKDPFMDDEFLKALASNRERVIYAKIVSLDIDENPIEEIQGRVTQGSVPVDGNSIVRRTCSLTLTAKELNINDYLWGLKTKVRLFIGLENELDDAYAPIIWYKMGTYVLTSFSKSISASGYTISIQGKDKMCLLNGDVGGALTALSYDFGAMEVINKDGYTYVEQIPLKRIIREAVHTFAKEPYHNIIINDLDDCGLELLEYRGDTPLYFIYDVEANEISNMVLDENQQYYINGASTMTSLGTVAKAIADNPDNPPYHFKTFANLMDIDDTLSTKFYGEANGNGKLYYIIQITKGMTCGYRTCELVYAGQLTSSAGEPITSMLSKIVSMLGDFEYFYNLDGQFVFQRKRTYVNTSWNNMTNNGEENWVENAAYTASYLFSFENGTLVTSYQNAPNLANLKNDFAIWGTRTGIAGSAIPIHLRFAIDHKPTYYTTWEGITYTTKTEEEVEWDKQNMDIDIPNEGYQKEKSRFGLSEDWWEVRDWAKAWQYSGLDIPTNNLGTYCPTKAIVHAKSQPLTSPPTANQEDYTVPDDIWKDWQSSYAKILTDDLIFTANGKLQTYHGGCTHPYSWWLNAIDSTYKDGYAYFYKPQVPMEDVIINNGQGLILGKEIKYEMDWRELIYQMAIDFNKHNNDDDFLATIRENNKSFYPTGYTGYEQYYLDLSGFWRQLYDPDYITSFNPIYIPKSSYEQESKFGNWYYDAPIYTRCKADDPFFAGITYYIYKDNEYQAVKNLTSAEYGNNNPTNYFRITGSNIEPIRLETEPYSSNQVYYTHTIDGYQRYGMILTQTAYEQNKINLFVDVKNRNYFPCRTMKPFQRGKLYFVEVPEEPGTYKPDTTINEETYLASPGKYFERAIIGGVITFSNCTKVIDFEDGREYYQPIKDNTGTIISYGNVLNINKTAYEANGFDNDYYYAVITTTYKPCVHPKYPYDYNMNYYEEGIKEYEIDPESPYRYWNKAVLEAPETLNFWIDFLDTYGDLSEFAVQSVGDRPKAVNDNNVKAIYFRETPGVIFVENLHENFDRKSGYTYAQLPQHLEYLFTISGQGKSAKDVLDSYLYSYSYCTESITIAAIPVYHLEPNTRIFVRDDESGISGEYIVTRINFPLDANGTMSINATKVVDRIY